MVTIQCEKCLKQISVSKDRLKAFEGKGILIPCPQCGFSIKYKVAKPDRILQPEDPPTIISTSRFGKTKGRLEIISNENTNKQEFFLAVGKNIIGRYSPSIGQLQEAIAIHTNDQSMSRQHCIIEVRMEGGNNNYLLSDNGSKNGTYLGAKKLDPKETLHLTHGDSIRIGGTTLIFSLLS